MKHSNFALAILSAIILSACGSSSSNDNQSVDPTPSPTPNQNSNTTTPTPTPSPAKPISPAANPNPESIPQQQSSSNANNNQPISSQTTPIVKAKPNPKTAGGSKQKQNKGQGQNTQTPSNGKLPVPEKADFSKTPEAAEKDHLSAVEEDVKADLEKAKAAQALLDATAAANVATAALTSAVSGIEMKANALNAANNATPPDPTAIAAAKVKLAAASQTLKTAQEKLRTALENKTKAAIEDIVAKQQKLIATQNVNTAKAVADAVKAKSTEPQAVIDSLEADAAFEAAEAARIAARAELKIAEKEIEKIKEEIDVLKNAIDENQKVVENPKVPAEDKAIAQAAIDADKKKQDELKIAQQAANDKVSDATVKLGTAKGEKKAASDKKAKANSDIKYRGVYGSNGAYSSTSFQNVSKADKDTSNVWTLTLKDGGEIKIDTSTGFNDLKDAASMTTYGRFGQVDEKDVVVSPANGFTKSIYGVYDGKFFSAGEVATSDPANGSYNGTAILKTTEGNVDLVAKVTATVAGKEFTGTFQDFRSYAISGGTGAVGDSDYKGNGFTGTSTTDKVSFKAKIDGKKFVPVEKPAANEAKVYGYFYESKQIGGLVEHKNFNGAFGVKNP